MIDLYRWWICFVFGHDYEFEQVIYTVRLYRCNKCNNIRTVENE